MQWVLDLSPAPEEQLISDGNDFKSKWDFCSYLLF